MLKKIGKYEIAAEIGSGGMGTVYKAYQPSLNRYVAIKVLPAQFSHDKELIERFYREAKAAAKLNHPNIAQIYDIGEEEGIYYFAMEFIKGKPLNALIKEKGTLQTEEVINITEQIAEALSCAHKENLIHRDIKPGNILVDEGGHVKVTDFGIAKVVESEGLTITGTIIGTPEYMSPEQARGDPIDRRSDIYSLGITIYEMITGILPFKATTPYGIIQKQINEIAKPVMDIIPSCPKELQYIVQRAMAKNLQERYQDAGELIQDLKNFRLGIFSERTLEFMAKKTKARKIWWVAGIVFAGIALIIGYNLYSARRAENFIQKKKAISTPEVKEKIVIRSEKIEEAKEPEAEKVKLMDIQAEKQVMSGEKLLGEEKYSEAISLFQKIIDTYPGTKWVEVSREKILFARQKLNEIEIKKGEESIKKIFLKGDNLFKEKKFGEAILSYQEIIDLYPVSRYADEARKKIEYIKEKIGEDKISALFSRAMEYENKDELVKATAIYQEILTKYPEGESANKAKEGLARVEKLEKEDVVIDDMPAIEKLAVSLFDRDSKVREMAMKGENEPLALYLKKTYPEDMKKVAEMMGVSEKDMENWIPYRFAAEMIGRGPRGERIEKEDKARDFIRKQRFPR